MKLACFSGMQCFLTGVKSKFRYQGKFDLEAYIDDGSLIYLVKIDHNVSLSLSLNPTLRHNLVVHSWYSSNASCTIKTK